MSYNIFLYKPQKVSSLNLSEIRDYISYKYKSKLNVEIRGISLKNKEGLAKKFASIRVINANKEFSLNEPFLGETKFEKKVLAGEILSEGILYDGFGLQSLFRDLIKKEELRLNNIHIFITNRLIGTFDEDDKRYHARTNIMGIPSIISLIGIVEAPAKPREFYLLKQKNIPIEILKEKFKGEFIDYNDPRLTDIIKGYVMQSIFYHLFNDAFCENKDCRLFNAHWQEELINAQLGRNKFCKKHSDMLKQLYSTHL